MDKKILLDARQIELTISRMCHQLIENHQKFENSVLLGLQPRGIYFANKIKDRLAKELDLEIPLGYLDTTFFRDDFRRRDAPLKPEVNNVPFLIENKRVILVDDVLFTGRSIRAALDAMQAFGRPEKVELAVLIERKYAREMPVEAAYIGRSVNSLQSQKVSVEWKDVGEAKEDCIWLLDGSN